MIALTLGSVPFTGRFVMVPVGPESMSPSLGSIRVLVLHCCPGSLKSVCVVSRSLLMVLTMLEHVTLTVLSTAGNVGPVGPLTGQPLLLAGPRWLSHWSVESGTPSPSVSGSVPALPLEGKDRTSTNAFLPVAVLPACTPITTGPEGAFTSNV